jgi:hypothetical protein
MLRRESIRLLSRSPPALQHGKEPLSRLQYKRTAAGRRARPGQLMASKSQMIGDCNAETDIGIISSFIILFHIQWGPSESDR